MHSFFLNPRPPGGSLQTIGTASDALDYSLEMVTIPGGTGEGWNKGA